MNKIAKSQSVEKKNAGLQRAQDKCRTNKTAPANNKARSRPVKVSNDLANISHKNTFGANNWKKFLETLQPPKSSSKSRTVFNKGKTSSFVSTGQKKQNFTNTNNSGKRNCTFSNGKINSKIERMNRIRPTLNSLALNERPPDQFHKKLSLLGPRHCKGSKSGMPSSFLSDKIQSSSKFKPCSELGRNMSKTNMPKLTKQVAIDCEMVGVEVGVDKSILARVSLVNAEGDCIYDKYVKPSEPVLDYRTFVSGIRPEDLENAPDFKIVQKEVADIIAGRVLVGHALNNDLKVLFLTHPKHLIRDTSKFKKFRVGRTFSLKKLAQKYLGVTIQEGEHSSVQDALAAMQLYRMFRQTWEASLHMHKKKKRTCPLGDKRKKVPEVKDLISSVDV